MRRIALALAVVLVAGAAAAFVPKANRVAKAVASTNQKDKRAQALRLEIALRVGGGEPVARGELVTHPTGLARLELRGSGDLVERHLLRGNEHMASRNGRVLDRPRAFLPPLFLLQADTAVTLGAALESFGVQADAIGLAPCGQNDCFVLGDRERVAPPADAAPALRDEPRDERRSRRAPKVWVDVATYELLGVDSGDGTEVRFGPAAEFERVRFPAWFRVEEPDKRPARFEILSATPVNAPATAFAEAWLFDAPDPAEQPPPSP